MPVYDAKSIPAEVRIGRWAEKEETEALIEAATKRGREVGLGVQSVAGSQAARLFMLCDH
ncbi:MAG TPA: hypothetical protein VHY79_18070 [Rhizomicrobium sp.]|jgi:hypothetical protein|nr:hypothetical protein [Rhizomicrobium sp.]